ncbi:hypothetical protein FHR84_004427 [Actinopolyspora biskrensis]|uniref:Uncharacterized protein n=1 Tax=Actinopolyspora biskrensis TaxID=1470178 RepID=A0A852ZGA5_9ACTN|nr:hypothetical protein [Actinopolyspora biskrensis]NYH81053.1 hypothetical protein [Actinopolyspora biskrensis]
MPPRWRSTGIGAASTAFVALHSTLGPCCKHVPVLATDAILLVRLAGLLVISAVLVAASSSHPARD